MRPSEFSRRQRQVLNHLEKAAALLAEMEPPERGQRARSAAEEARQQAIIQAARENPALTLEEIGQQFGVSRQRVDQVLRKRGLAAERTQQARRVRRAMKAAVEERRLDERAKKLRGRTCRVCYGPIPVERDLRAKSCSDRCQQLWSMARLHLDPRAYELHRLAIARNIVAHPEGKRPAHIEWAHKMLNGQKPPPNRRYITRSSAAGEALEEIIALRNRSEVA